MLDSSSAKQEAEESLGEIALRLDVLIQYFEQHPLVQVREQAMEMLSLIDALHREGILHLADLCRSQGHVEQMMADPAINMLLMLYGLVSPEPREQVEIALAAIGPYIATQGTSIEVLDVDDGIVQLHLSGLKVLDAETQAQITQEIELTLKESFPGFRSMIVHEQSKVPVRAGTFIPLQKIGSVKRRSS